MLTTIFDCDLINLLLHGKAPPTPFYSNFGEFLSSSRNSFKMIKKLNFKRATFSFRSVFSRLGLVDILPGG